MGSTLLFYAVMSDDPDVLQFLVRAGLSIDAQRKDGETPLHIACIRNKLKAARWLVANGANTELRDNWSRRAADCIGHANAELEALLAVKKPGVVDVSLSVVDFAEQLRVRLRDRWQCSHPQGFSESEIRACDPSGNCMPEIYATFLRTCGKGMGQMFRTYELRACDTATSRQEFEGFLNSFSISMPPAMHFLTYRREEYWAFPRHRTGAEVNDPKVLHITVEGILPKSCRLSNFFLTWEQFE